MSISAKYAMKKTYKYTVQHMQILLFFCDFSPRNTDTACS